jgi:hypothetical protein
MTDTPPKTARIYALVDAHNDIKYVGSTGMDIQERARIHHRHRNAVKRGNEELNAWLKSMERPPVAVLLVEVAWPDRIKAETHWTRWARGVYGAELLNKMDGATPTEEILRRKRENRLGHYRPHSAQAREKISTGVRRHWVKRRGFTAEQARLELELGPLYRLPRSAEELADQINLSTAA